MTTSTQLYTLDDQDDAVVKNDIEKVKETNKNTFENHLKYSVVSIISTVLLYIQFGKISE